jgi:hypothetical protein
MRRANVVCLAIPLVLGLPLLGVFLSGQPISRYLEFPPHTSYVEHEPFSWPAFMALGLLILGIVGPLVVRVVAFDSHRLPETPAQVEPTHHSFPWWGSVGIGWTGLWWVLAWTRFSWMALLQEHTFTPLWIGYIVIVNAWTFARTGRCMMLHRPRYMFSLFPLSAAFWWVFEYLNRFVQNWYYVGVAELEPLGYFLRGTIPFATVLPAVLSTAELLISFPAASAGLIQFKPIRVESVKLISWSTLILSWAGLFAMGLWPNYLFPLVWIGPLLVVVSLQALVGQSTIISPLAQGDWGRIWVPAIAALICGLFWELWNWKSLAHWQYAVPFVQRFQVFEMPVLGYAGYLPFGLECLVVADLCLTRQFFGGVEDYRTLAEEPERIVR